MMMVHTLKSWELLDYQGVKRRKGGESPFTQKYNLDFRKAAALMRTAADTDVMWQEIIIQSVILHTLTSRINASTRCWHITLSLEWCFSEVTFTVIYTLCEKGLLLLSNTAVCYLFYI